MTEDYRIRYVRKTGGHPVEALVQLAIAEQFARGWRHPITDIPATGYDQEALWIDHGGKAIAVLQFHRRDWDRSIQTAWSYTAPQYRRQGFNVKLFQALAAIATRDGYGYIDRGTHPDNHAMIAAFEAAGGKLMRVGYRFLVEDRLDAINDRYEAP